MQSGRRFFITGWRSTDALAAFEDRLARAANGGLVRLQTPAGRAWRFEPQDDGDVVLARGLCAEYDVALCLRTQPVKPSARPTFERASLVVDPARLHALQRYGEGANAVWRAQAGCTLGLLADAGLTQFQGLARDVTLAQWASDRHPGIPTGQTARTGVVGADVLFADGTVETLGGFGADDTRALKAPQVQTLVPALFRLTQDASVAALLDDVSWPARIRLDALMAVGARGDINVARAFLGHGGRHVWVLQWLLRATPAPMAGPVSVPHHPEGRDASTGDRRARPEAGDTWMHPVDAAVAQLVDPGNRYGGATAIA